MRQKSPIPGISFRVFSDVLSSQAHSESKVIKNDPVLRQSDFYEHFLFFIGIAYHPNKFAGELIKIEKYLCARQNLLSDIELGIYYHLKGFLISKKGTDNLHIVFDALNNSLVHLNHAKSRAARYYSSRVSDTYAQVLQSIGFYADALVLFQESLKIKKTFKDEPAVALTHGNLGRLYFEIGNFQKGLKHLQLDLKITRKTGGHESLLSKLMNQAAMGMIEMNKFKTAKKIIEQSLIYAESSGPESSFFAMYTMAYYFLQTRETVFTQKIISKLQEIHLEKAEDIYTGIYQSRIDYLSAMLALLVDKPSEAIGFFKKSEKVFIDDFSNSLTEKARFYYNMSEAYYRSGLLNESSAQLRKALSFLDKTENTPLRKKYEETLKERFRDAWLLHSAGRFIGQGQIETILDGTGEDVSRSETTEVGVMFSDIRDFTKLAEGMNAGDLVELLNKYLSTMSKYIHLQGGNIDKYIGDAIMASFYPNDKSGMSAAEKSCISALMMKYELRRFNRYLPSGTPEIQAGIGINFGTCVCGLIGTAEKKSVSVIGDTVNTASRIEGLTKLLGADIIISEPLYGQLPGNHIFIIRPLGKYKLKGKNIPVVLAELMGIDNHSAETDSLKEEIKLVNKTLNQFYLADLPGAYSGFKELYNLARKHKRSSGYKYMTDYTRLLLDSGIPNEWDGSFEILAK
jgi:class 3 adenylate cyclase